MELISKKQFKYLMKIIQKYNKQSEKIEDFLETIIDGYAVLKRDFSNDIITFLEDYFCNGYDYISWWLYDDVEKLIWENGEDNPPTDVSTLDKLYDFLVRLKKESIDAK